MYSSCLQDMHCMPSHLAKKDNNNQRWSSRGRPRGHILKSLALASKPQVLENCPVPGSRTVLFLNRWNFVGKRPKPCGKSAKTFVLVSSSRYRLKKILKTFFFWRTLASVSFVLGLERVWLWPWPRNFFVSLALTSSFTSSTPPLIII